MSETYYSVMGGRTAVRWHGGSFFRLRDARGIISVWVNFAGSVVTLSSGKSALFEKCSLSEPLRGEFEHFSNAFSRFSET